MTTREKILAVIDAFKQTPAEELSADVRPLIEALQIAQGFGIDVVGYVVPDSDAEADVLVDKTIAMLLAVRGDDLPPFDPDRYGEAHDEEPEAA